MREYGFSLTRILPYKGKILRFCPYTGEYGSVKSRIFAYFMQSLVFESFNTTGVTVYMS